jgi:hypothetical protein
MIRKAAIAAASITAVTALSLTTTVTQSSASVLDPHCNPRPSAGKCYEPGEFCPKGDHGKSGIAGDYKKITCKNSNGWRWEPVK